MYVSSILLQTKSRQSLLLHHLTKINSNCILNTYQLIFMTKIIVFNEFKLQDMSTCNRLNVCIFSLSPSLPPFLQFKGLSNPILYTFDIQLLTEIFCKFCKFNVYHPIAAMPSDRSYALITSAILFQHLHIQQRLHIHHFK